MNGLGPYIHKVFYEEAYKEIERSTGPLSQSSLWLLGEMHFLGRGTKADLSLGRKFIQQASSKSLSSKHANLLSGLKPICSSSNTLCSDVLKSKALSPRSLNSWTKKGDVWALWM